MRAIGGALKGLGDILLKVGIPGVKRRDGEEEGDRTLALLSIPDASISKSAFVLAKMLAVHIAVAWMGLVFSKPRRNL